MGGLSKFAGGDQSPITGGAATATSGDARGTQAGGGGAFGPVIIGGFKSSGSANAVFPPWMLWAAAAGLAWWLWKQARK